MNTRQTFSKVVFASFGLCILFFLIGANGYGVIQIDSIQKLQKIGNDASYPLNGEYELTQDIDASNTINWDSGAGFLPIGTSSNPFVGKFNGNGHKIRRLYINRSGQDYVGLFGYVGRYGEITNLGIEEGWVIGGDNTGILVGYSRGIVRNCYSTGSVVGDQLVGGLVGKNGGTVSQSYSTGSVLGRGYVGGLVGENGGTVNQSYSTGIVVGDDGVGGLVGGSEGTVSQSYSTGSVSGVNYVGGLVGYNYRGTVSESYSTGSVSGYEEVGGLVGYNDEGTVSDSYWDIETSGQSSSDGGTGKTTAQMKQQATYLGWDFVNVWAINEGVSYPYLRVLGPSQEPLPPEEKEIWSLSDLSKIGRDCKYPWDGVYKLMADIDASETINWDGGKGFNPIGVFTGRFDGNGHKIRRLYINRSGQNNVGLFGYVGGGGEITNLGIEEGWVRGGWCTGILVGYNDRGIVNNCYSTGSVSGSYNVGGLVGENWGTVSQSYSTGSVSGGSNVGGLVGSNEGTVSQSYSTGSVSGRTSVGGLVGGNDGTVSQSYSTGSVSGGSSNVGGLVGWNDSGTVSQSYSTGSVSWNRYVGRLVGRNYNGTVSDSYWDIETSRRSSSEGGEGKTTLEMKQQATYVGWDFTTVWGIVESSSYPYLLWQGGPLVNVPDVVGMNQSSAESTITGAGLTVGTVTQQCSNTVTAGKVINQSPTAGQQVNPGTSVNLVVSTGSCVSVPDVVGISQSSAESAITGAGLTVGTITQQCSNEVSAGKVISQIPTAGTQVSPGSEVDLVVSTGPCPEGEGSTEGVVEGTPEGATEGTPEGTPEGAPEGIVEGTPEGTP